MMILKSKAEKPVGKMAFGVKNIDSCVPELGFRFITFHMYEIRK